MLMEDKKKVAKNIRDLRDAYGETQEELGFTIGVEKNTISQYEKGKRFPKQEILAKIALHYRITIDELLTGEFSGLRLTQMFNDESALKDASKKMFPIVTSKEAEQDPYFCKAFALHKKIIKELDVETFDEMDFELCLDNYETSIEEYNTPESAGNLIAILLLLATAVFFEPVSEKYQSVKKKKGDMATVLKESWLRDCEAESEQDNDARAEAKEFLDDVQEMLTELLLMLKKSKRLEELADYYIAMMYLLRLVNNEQSEETNCVIGNEMIEIQLRLKNPYTIQYVRTMIDINKSIK